MTTSPIHLSAVANSAVILSDAQKQDITCKAGAALTAWAKGFYDQHGFTPATQQVDEKLKTITANITKSAESGYGRSKEAAKETRKLRVAATATLRQAAYEDKIRFFHVRNYNKLSQHPSNMGGLTIAYKFFMEEDAFVPSIKIAMAICRADEPFDKFMGMEGSYLRLLAHEVHDQNTVLVYEADPVRDRWDEEFLWNLADEYRRLLEVNESTRFAEEFAKTEGESQLLNGAEVLTG